MAEETVNKIVDENSKKTIDEEELRKTEQLVKDVEALNLMKYNLGLTKKPDMHKEYKFWKTQPVPKFGEFKKT